MIDLRRFRERDIPRLLTWIDSPETLMHWSGARFDYPLTKADMQRHLATAGRRLICKGVDAGTKQVVGHGEITPMGALNGTVRLARILVDPNCRGQGYGTALTRALVELAFAQPDTHRVDLYVFADNGPAIACYEKVGFKREGLLREAFGFEGAYYSLLPMSILEEERGDTGRPSR